MAPRPHRYPMLLSLVLVLACADPPGVTLDAELEPSPDATANENRGNDTDVASPLYSDAQSYEAGERILVHFRDAPGNPGDWVGLFPAGEDRATGALLHQYTDASEGETAAIQEGLLVFRPSLAEGEYELRLYPHDAHEPIHRHAFRIESRCPTPIPQPEQAHTLSSMTLKLWPERPGVTPYWAGVAELIAEVSADIVALQSCDSNCIDGITENLRELPSYHSIHSDAEAAILSRTPLLTRYLQAGVSTLGVHTRLPSGHNLRVFNANFAEIPYGPHAFRDGLGPERVHQDDEAHQGREASIALTQLIELEQNSPHWTTLFLGDFASPSSLDWREDNREQNFGISRAWSASSAILAAGFNDSYRSRHPDPRRQRGFTWSAGAPPPLQAAEEVHDRRAMIYLRAGRGHRLRVVESFTLDRSPWPSNHRAVVTHWRFE